MFQSVLDGRGDEQWVESQKGPDGQRTWLLGERFTGADMLMTTCLDWAVRYGLPLADSLMAYLARATARPGFIAAREANDPAYWTAAGTPT